MVDEQSVEAALAVSASENFCACAVPGCEIPGSERLPFCKDHWSQLPGKVRAKLSLTCRHMRNPITQALIEREAGKLRTVRNAR